VNEDEEEGELDELECLHVSRHRSSMLDLNSLRLEMQEKGDIASTVVRIEVGAVFVLLFVLACHNRLDEDE